MEDNMELKYYLLVKFPYIEAKIKDKQNVCSLKYMLRAKLELESY